MEKPFSQACENNKQPILSVLQRYLVDPGSVLEVGSGTGQHAAFLATQLPHIQWQPTDVPAHLDGIRLWCEAAAAPNLLPPQAFDVTTPGPAAHDHLFSANTLHIMGWETVQALFRQLPALVNPDGYVFFYGPFNYQGQYTSPSNAQFDQWLQQHHPRQGIRDFEAVAELAAAAGLELVEDVSMPANNQTLVWQRRR